MTSDSERLFRPLGGVVGAFVQGRGLKILFTRLALMIGHWGGLFRAIFQREMRQREVSHV
jgi:hypothetical protein